MSTQVIVDTKELAQGYIRVNETQRDAGSFLLDKLGVAPGQRVLDVGCGPGDLTARIADIVGKDGTVTGVDPSSERIAMAVGKARPNLSFYEGRAEDLSRFPSASFDIVFVNSTLHWVKDQALALAEFSRVLKPGGRVGISGQSGDFVAAHEKIKAEVLSRERYRIYPDQAGPKFLKKSELNNLLDAAGFGGREFAINTIVKSAKDGYAMIEWLDTSSSGKTYGGIPLDLRPSAREEMNLEWDKLTTKDGISMEIDLLVTVATKS
ncbi:S-adenosyl-L-methionine-dependent methyltransferase [Xylariales sp. PMI_506]|nr:S-adenosyl-L-methionine-dependent methyltransferase [Xylariales sp. PMI_506]